VGKAKWAHVDFGTAEWTIPKENSKNGIEHVVNLSAFALRQFAELRSEAEASAKKLEREVSDYVLPARMHQGHVCEKSLAKQIGDRQRKDKKPMSRRSSMTDSLTLPGGRWTPHDLRRTGATVMGNRGVRPDVIEKCLNHIDQNRIKRIYQRQTLRPEMREAWKLLGEHLEVLTTTNRNVVPLDRTKSRSLTASRTSARITNFDRT